MYQITQQRKIRINSALSKFYDGLAHGVNVLLLAGANRDRFVAEFADLIFCGGKSLRVSCVGLA